MRVAVVVPVYNRPGELRECLAALRPQLEPGDSITVVDDASTDETASVARAMGADVVRAAERRGAGMARNQGARHARGDVLLFVDSDVLLHPGSIDRVRRTFEERPEIAAMFGSYDASPRAQQVVSQFRNLLHHYVHQRGEEEASTFWAAVGAVRRTAFEAVGGFAEGYFGRYMEDIEIGYRLRRAGYRILLDRDWQGQHLKRWTLASMVRTDVVARAVPWTRLILSWKDAPRNLNVAPGQQLSIALVSLACLLTALSPLRPDLLWAAAGALLVVLLLNWDLYRFLYRRRGLRFATASFPLHLLYYLSGGLGFLWGWVAHRLGRPP